MHFTIVIYLLKTFGVICERPWMNSKFVQKIQFSLYTPNYNLLNLKMDKRKWKFYNNKTMQKYMLSSKWKVTSKWNLLTLSIFSWSILIVSFIMMETFHVNGHLLLFNKLSKSMYFFYKLAITKIKIY